jgi:hypothetical protein
MSSRNERTALAGPEELVSQENKALTCLRILMVVVLIVVGSALSLACYKLTSKWEEQVYNADFNAIAMRCVQHFQNTLTQLMLSANTVAMAVSVSSASEAAPNTTIPLFDKLALGTLLTSNLNNVFWSPLIWNKTERNEWEVFANQHLAALNSTTDKCYVCGSTGLEVGLPQVPVQLPFGKYTCGKPVICRNLSFVSNNNQPFHVWLPTCCRNIGLGRT